jgi:transcription elongation factor S-II
MCNNYSDKYRFKIVELFITELDDENISRKIERSIYNYTINLAKKKLIKKKWTNTVFKNLYLTKVKSIYSNINEKSYVKNKTFKKRILSGEINPDNICDLSSYDIFPDVWKELIDNKIKKDKLKYELKPEAMTNVFKCRKCNSRSCSYYEVQTRSADEPMTQFINCLDCGNRWRQ